MAARLPLVLVLGRVAELPAADTLVADALKANIASPVLTGNLYFQQAAPVVANATATLTIANLLVGMVQSTNTVAVSLTLPTGTLTNAGVLAGTLAVDRAFEWLLVNTGTTSGAVTLLAGVGHTIIGSAVIAIGTSAKFRTRKTAANTFITYRI